MDALSIGRAPDNDLVLKDEKVSRYHARLYYRSGRWHLVDLQSTHGTKVNGEKVESPVKLRPNDSIRASGMKIIFDGRNLLSVDGKILASLTGSSSEQKSTAFEKEKASNKPAIFAAAGIISIFLVVVVVILALSESNQNPPPEVEAQAQPEVIIQHGTIELDEGLYTGDLRNGEPHGYGTLVYSRGRQSSAFSEVFLPDAERMQKYEGQWQNGYKHGNGKMIYRDGTVIEGRWEYGRYVRPEGN